MMNVSDLDRGVSRLARGSLPDIGDEMREYQRRSSAGTIHPNAPYVILLTLDKSCTFALSVGESTPLNEKASRAMLSIAGAVLKYVEKAECAMVEPDAASVLVNAGSPHLLGEIDRINSLCASLATAILFDVYKDTDKLPLDRPLIRCQTFALASESVPDFFVWRQLEAWRKCVDACLWEALGSTKDGVQELFDFGSIEQKQARYTQLTGKSAHQTEPWYRRGMIVRRVMLRRRNKQDNGWLLGRKGWAVDPTPPIFLRNPEYLRTLLGDPPPDMIACGPQEIDSTRTGVLFSLPGKEPTAYREVSPQELDDTFCTE